VNSNSFLLLVGPNASSEKWMAWGTEFARRHRLRLIVFLSARRIDLTSKFLHRTLVVHSRRFERLIDRATLAFRALDKIRVVPHESAPLIEADNRQKHRDAHFALDMRVIEPLLKNMPNDLADELRQHLRHVWENNRED
jgi:hypothetical protein